jgi:hypothetical protein
MEGLARDRYRSNHQEVEVVCRKDQGFFLIILGLTSRTISGSRVVFITSRRGCSSAHEFDADLSVTISRSQAAFVTSRRGCSSADEFGAVLSVTFFFYCGCLVEVGQRTRKFLLPFQFTVHDLDSSYLETSSSCCKRRPCYLQVTLKFFTISQHVVLRRMFCRQV